MLYQTIKQGVALAPRIRLGYSLRYTVLRRGIQTMYNDNTDQMKRRSKWMTYSTMTGPEAEKRLGFRLNKLEADAIPVKTMLDGQSRVVEEDAVNETKAKVYDRIVEYLEVEGYPTESGYFGGANINDLVYTMIVPIIFDFRRKTGRKSLHLQRDYETGGTEEFVVMDLISVMKDRFVFVIVAKTSLGEAKKQCLLSMKDMKERNIEGEVYGFLTTGYSWRMVRYDGSFQMTDKFDILFGGIGKDREAWMKDYSVLVDCMYCALSNGGIVKKNVVV